MQGRRDEARCLIASALDRLSVLGLILTHIGTRLVQAEIELLAGAPASAEDVLRDGLAKLRELDEAVLASDFAASLSRVVLTRGEHDEARELAEEAAASKAFDIAVPVVLRGTKARLAASEGNHVRAIELAHGATSIAGRTDLTNLQADAQITLGDVLAAEGNGQAAMTAWRHALSLYEAKGNLVSASEVRSKLA